VLSLYCQVIFVSVWLYWAELYKLNYDVRSGVDWLSKWNCNLIVPLGMHILNTPVERSCNFMV